MEPLIESLFLWLLGFGLFFAWVAGFYTHRWLSKQEEEYKGPFYEDGKGL